MSEIADFEELKELFKTDSAQEEATNIVMDALQTRFNNGLDNDEYFLTRLKYMKLTKGDSKLIVKLWHRQRQDALNRKITIPNKTYSTSSKKAVPDKESALNYMMSNFKNFKREGI